jgi:antitoxin ParD1/3/4
MPTRNVVLTDHQARLVERLVDSGRYQNASEVLREGIRLVEQQEAEHAARLRALREAAAGIVDIDAGYYRTFEALEPLREHLDGLARELRALHDRMDVEEW